MRVDDPKVEKPAEHFEKPKDVVKDVDLSKREKTDALDTWEQDAQHDNLAGIPFTHACEGRH